MDGPGNMNMPVIPPKELAAADQSDATWSDAYPPIYEHHSQSNGAHRERRREKDRARRIRKAAAGQGPTKEEVALSETFRYRAHSRQAVVDLRWNRGFVWHGGPVGGNAEYQRQGFTYPGLVSDEAPILKLFVSKTHRTRALITGDTKSDADGTDSKLLALDCAYVETNKAMCAVLRVELDTLWPSWETLATAIHAQGVPPPNVAVGHVDAAGRVWRPHLIWILAESVVFTNKGSRRPQAAWWNALHGLTAALLPLGADPGGRSNAHRHKNPVSPLWARWVMAPEPYALDVDKRQDGPCHAPLRPFLPTPQEAIDALRAAEAASRAAPQVPQPDHPDKAVAFESNAVWRHLAVLARQRVALHRDQGRGSHEEFEAELVLEALRISPPGLKAEKAATGKVRSIVKWTWTHYRAAEPKLPLEPEERAARQRDGQAKAAAGRRTEAIATAAAAFRRIAATSGRPTQTAVAAAVGKSDRALRPYWAEIMAAAARPESEPEPEVQSSL